MAIYDVWLSDPEPDRVLDAIERAFDLVNEHGRTSKFVVMKASMNRLAERTSTEPEGLDFWASNPNVGVHDRAAQILVAWWTAPFGRRHVRVTGRIVDRRRSYLVNTLRMNARPPSWHVFPDRVYRRRVGAVNDLVATCGCGVCGTERTLNWAGQTCGPCFDYLQEHGVSPRGRPALLPTLSPCEAVAVSADGRWVAGATSAGVFVWDLDAGIEPVHAIKRGEGIETRASLALSADGSMLATTGTVYDGLRTFSLAGPRPKVASEVYGISSGAVFDPVAAISKSEDVLYLQGNGLRLAHSTKLGNGRLLLNNVEPRGPVVLSWDARLVAVRVRNQIHVHAYDVANPVPVPPVILTLPPSVRHNSERTPTIAEPAHLAFSPNGEQIAMGVDRAIAVHDVATGDRRFWDGKLPAEVTGVAYDPAGKWLYVVREDGSLLTYLTGSFDESRTVTFRWSLGPVRGLAASGDGETLFTACDEGVKAWPIRRLLEGT